MKTFAFTALLAATLLTSACATKMDNKTHNKNLTTYRQSNANLEPVAEAPRGNSSWGNNINPYPL